MLVLNSEVTLAVFRRCLSILGLTDSSRASCLVRGMLHRHTIVFMHLNSTPLVNGDGALAMALSKETMLECNLDTIRPSVGRLHMLRRYLCVALNSNGKPP